MRAHGGAGPHGRSSGGEGNERFLALMERARVSLAEERAWVEELEALPEGRRLERMLGAVAQWIDRAKGAQGPRDPA